MSVGAMVTGTVCQKQTLKSMLLGVWLENVSMHGYNNKIIITNNGNMT